MSVVPDGLPTTPQKPSSVQPGGGTCMALELAWGRLRRGFLRRFRPSYVRDMLAKRQGACPDCPHDIIDGRDLKYTRNVCGFWFRPEDDRFAWRNRLRFARHGLAEMFLFSALLLPVLGAFCGLALAVHFLFWIPALAAFLTWLEVVTFFRDPERRISAEPNTLVSAADGVVTHIEEVSEPDFPGRALRISIFLSIFNVHVNRMPRTGRITQVRYFPGAFLDARRVESAVRNEQLWIDMIDAATNRPLRVKQISGAIARRIVCWLKEGDVVSKGERLGMIKFGSRTDVLLPAEMVKDVCIKVGDAVRGGSTVLLIVR
jgi:phosphatidylserine decarboxylase